MRSDIFYASLGAVMCLFLNPIPSPAQTGGATVRVRETLDRGVHAQHLGNNTAYISWRLLETDGVNTGFNLYRRIGTGSAVKRNSTPIISTTDFLDTGATNGSDIFYEVKPVVNGRELQGSGEVNVNSSNPKNYVSFNTVNAAGKIGIGDLDGDGKYDYVVRTPDTNIDPYHWEESPATYKLRAYRHDGSPMWVYDMGWNIELGVWYAPFIVYDFDGDGKAEVAAKTAPSPGTKPTKPITTGPEYLTVFTTENGELKEKAEVDWPNPRLLQG